MSVIIVTAADDAYFGLAWAMIASVRAAGGRSVSFGLMDLGLKSEQRASLAENNVQVVTQTTGLARADGLRFPAAEMGYLARPFLRENFPGHEVYVWLDADSWVQDAEGYEGLAQAARQVGAAVVAETAHEYRFWPWLLGWRAKHYVFGYGLTRGIRLWLRPQINNGAFALTAGAPHWAVWQHYYQDALDRARCAA
ncbi:hypothetical protein [Devosia sp. 2618]|uniref:hypothetical protein n=1 Tax=Devosia sp. 2618 TaxID=3156454 RepID=UPI003399754E